ncbi:MAG: hypothetical protein ACE5GW_00530 [Planctomycetota bacterium]
MSGDTGGATVRGWITVLEKVLGRLGEDTLFIFGHGKKGFGVTGSKKDVKLQRDYFSALIEVVEKGLRKGEPREKVIASEALPGFPDHVGPGRRLSLGSCLAVTWDELSSERKEGSR